MIIEKIKDGGMEVWFVAQELSRLALLLDRAAYEVRESTGYKESTSDAEDLESLAAFFTASAVACEAHQGEETWFCRNGTKPTFQRPDKAPKQ